MTRIEVINNYVVRHPLSVPHRAMRQFYRQWIQPAYRRRQNVPEAAPAPFKSFDDLPAEALKRIAELCPGRYPISDHILSEPALIDLSQADREEVKPGSETPTGPWQDLPIEPAVRSY